MNRKLNVKLTPKRDKGIYIRSLPMPTHLIPDLNVGIALMHKYGTVRVLTSSKNGSPNFEQRKADEKLRLLVDLIRNSLQMTTPKRTTHSVLSQMQHNIWQRSLSPAGPIALNGITICKWRTNCQ